MRFTDTLPTPSLDALAHSEQLAARIRAVITANGGSIPFREFMQMALYEPGLGYYVAGSPKIGKEGDFITAPEISPLFSHCLANQCAQVLTELGGGDVLELGAGSGVMAADMLQRLEMLGCLPQHYRILDLSPELRDRQRQTLQARVPHLLERVEWLDRLPETPMRGVIVGNEVLDAMPVELFSLVGGERVIRQVEMHGDSFGLVEVGGEYTSEFNPALPGWMRSMAEVLEAGVLLLIDYGYEHDDYYHPDRSQGTLICHYQHRVHDQPLLYPGLQDITASVDFTAVAEAGVDAGLELGGYATQAAFLASSGLEDLFVQALQDNPTNQYKLAQQVRTLSLPSEMGERFKVIALNKGFSAELVGFQFADQRHRL
jgi:SAM-dependent MidA family methyltransferase